MKFVIVSQSPQGRLPCGVGDVVGLLVGVHQHPILGEHIRLRGQPAVHYRAVGSLHADVPGEEPLALGAVEKQKESEGKAGDGFTRGDMETCFVAGAQSMEALQEGCEGTFGQAVGSLKRGFLVRRKGWNGVGMFLFMRPFDSLKDDFIIDTVKSLPYNFKEWVKAHPNAEILLSLFIKVLHCLLNFDC